MRVRKPSPVLLSFVSAGSHILILLSYLGEPEDDDEEDEPLMAAAKRGNLVSAGRGCCPSSHCRRYLTGKPPDVHSQVTLRPIKDTEDDVDEEEEDEEGDEEDEDEDEEDEDEDEDEGTSHPSDCEWKQATGHHQLYNA